MNEKASVTISPRIERRKDRLDAPAFPHSRGLQRYAEQRFRFAVVRASDAVPGSKTWREHKCRSGDRVPFRTELEIVRAVVERAAESGSPEIFKEASDVAWDMVLSFTKLVRRIITEGETRLAQWDDNDTRAA